MSGAAPGFNAGAGHDPEVASPRGDQRREALLTALDEQLRTKHIDAISVADLTDAAGITRSAFYFYFDSKYAAVFTLLAGVESEAGDSTAALVGGEGTFRERIDAALVRLADRVHDRAHVYRALLTARPSHTPSRELWDAGRAVLAEPIVGFIRAERAAGRAPEGADPDELALALVQINESLLARLAYDPDQPREAMLATAADLWVRGIYGRPDPAVDAAQGAGA